MFVIAEELSDMRKQMKALEEKNVTYMKETMNLQEVNIYITLLLIMGKLSKFLKKRCCCCITGEYFKR